MLRTHYGNLAYFAGTLMGLPLLAAFLWIVLAHPPAQVAGALLVGVVATSIFCVMVSERVVRSSGAERYRQLAFTDDLTGLPNRRAALDRLERILARFTAAPESLTLAMLDLDGFKKVNDRLGHLAGDTVLKDFSEMLRAELRPSDWGARWGGDEFLIMIHGDVSDARRAMERIREAAEAAASRSQFAQCTVTIGIAAARFQEDAARLIGRADAALIFSKSLGGNRVCVQPETARVVRGVTSTLV